MNSAVVFGLITTILLVASGFIFKKNRVVTFLQLSWISILMGLNTGGPDFYANQMIFETAAIDYTSLTSGSLYGIVCNIFRSSGLDFIAMNLVLSLFSIIITYLIIRHCTSAKNAVISLFMVFPMFDFIIQKRAFVAEPFILLSLIFLNSKNRLRYVYSVIFTLIASQIHSSSFFFFLIIFLYFIYEEVLKEREKHHKKYQKIVAILVLVVYYSLSTIPGLVGKLMGAERAETYLGGDNISLSSAVAWMGIHIIFVLLHRFICNKNLEDGEFDKFVFTINTASLILLPLYLYDSVFFRLFKTVLIFNYISIINNIIGKKTGLNMIIYLSYIISVFMVVYVWSGLGFEVLISPLFENNIFINWFIGV